MAAPAAPTIVSAVRSATDPTMLQVTVSVPVSGVTQMRLYERGASGAGVIIFTGMPAGGGVITAKSRYAADASVSVAASLRTSDGWSAVGGYTNVAAFTVAAPNLLSATRTSETVVTLELTGLIPGATGRIYRAAPGKAPVAIGSAWTITGSTLTATAPAPDGNAEYVFAVMQTRFGVNSPLSTQRQVGVWWQAPPAPSMGTPSRNTGSGVTTVVWSNPTYTTRNRPIGHRYYRALKGAAKPASAWRTVTFSGLPPTQLTDGTGADASAYMYWVEPYNEAGPSSSAPSVSVDAVRERPNPASGVTVTDLGGREYRLNWSINATTVRPITGQQILGRTPGSTGSAVLAVVPGTTTEAFLTAEPNTVREVAVWTRNAVGAADSTSNWATTLLVGTPRNVTGLAASWSTPSTLYATWAVPAATIATQVEVEFSTEATPDPSNPAHWFPGGTVPLGDAGASVTAAPTVPHTFRVRAVHADSGVAADWVYSSKVAPQAAPHAPTVEMPYAVDATGSITLRARHNPVDGTPATAVQIRYRRQGLTTWTTRTATPSQPWYVIAAGTYTNGQTLEVQGRTAGATGVYGEWGHVTAGAVLTVPLQARPVVEITSPTGTLYHSQQMTVTWTASEQASARLELWDDTDGVLDLLGTATVGPEVRSYTWPDVVLRDGRDILVSVAVHDGRQQADPQSKTVRTQIILPGPPLLRAEDGADASVVLYATPTNSATLVRTNRFQGINTARNLWLGGLDPDDVQWQSMGGRDVIRVMDTTASSLKHTPAPQAGEVLAMTVAVRNPTVIYASGQSITIPTGWPATHRIEFPAQSDNATTIGMDDPSLTNALWMWDIYLGQPGDTTHFDADSDDPEHFYRTTEYGNVEEWTYGGTDSLPPTGRIEIWCSPDGETGWEPCGETQTDWSYHDRHPAIGVPLHYRPRAYTAAGAWADGNVVTHVVRSRDVWVHFGPDHREAVRGGARTLTQRGGGLAVEAVQYEGHPTYTAHTGDQPVADSIDVDLQLLPATGASSLEEWKRALQHADVIYREPGGIVMRGVPILEGRTPESMFRQTVAFSVLGTRQ